MSRNKSTLSLALSGIAAGGFTRHTHVRYRPGTPPAAQAELPAAAQAFDYPRAPIEFKNRVLPELETRNHAVRYVRFPSAGVCRQPDNLLTARYYQSKRAGRKKLLIVLPIFGSYTYPAEAMVRTLRRRYGGECHILEVTAENYLLDWVGLAKVDSRAALIAKAREMAEYIRMAIVDLRRWIDWAAARAEVDPRRIALIGFSMSAFLVGLALGVERRLAAGVVIMGGARPADIMATCGGKPGMARAAVLSRLGISWRQYYSVLAEAARDNDPVHFAGCYRPERILLFDARYDTCMPERAREDLWKAMGRPERYTMHYGHKSAFLAMTPLGWNFIRRKTADFLERILGADGESTTSSRGDSRYPDGFAG